MVDHRKTDEKHLDRLFHALSDSTRRRIIDLLREAGQLKVGDIASSFSMSLNGVSKHLKVLESAGVVRRRVVGREHWLRVDWPSLEAGYAFLHFYKHFWEKRLDALIEHIEQKDDTHE